MQPEHYIEWISLHTKQGNQRKELKPGDAPKAVFALVDGDEVESAYAYCNLHGLWKKVNLVVNGQLSIVNSQWPLDASVAGFECS